MSGHLNFYSELMFNSVPNKMEIVDLHWRLSSDLYICHALILTHTNIYKHTHLHIIYKQIQNLKISNFKKTKKLVFLKQEKSLSPFKAMRKQDFSPYPSQVFNWLHKTHSHWGRQSSSLCLPSQMLTSTKSLHSKTQPNVWAHMDNHHGYHHEIPSWWYLSSPVMASTIKIPRYLHSSNLCFRTVITMWT